MIDKAEYNHRNVCLGESTGDPLGESQLKGVAR